jgi:hypothetical protein
MLVEKENLDRCTNLFSESPLHKIMKLYIGDYFLKKGYSVNFEKGINKNKRKHVDLMLEKNNKISIVECISGDGIIPMTIVHNVVNTLYKRRREKKLRQLTTIKLFIVIPEEFEVRWSENLSLELLELLPAFAKDFRAELLIAPFHTKSGHKESTIVKLKKITLDKVLFSVDEQNIPIYQYRDIKK